MGIMGTSGEKRPGNLGRGTIKEWGKKTNTEQWSNKKKRFVPHSSPHLDEKMWRETQGRTLASTTKR